MNPKVRTMLEKMYEITQRKFSDPVEAWDHFLEFLVADNSWQLVHQMDHQFQWLFKDSNLAQSLQDCYRPELLKSDQYDHLGEMYFEKILSDHEAKEKSNYLTPPNVAKSMARMATENTDQGGNILDPAVGTGRLLLAIRSLEPRIQLWGVDSDLRSLRIAMTNCKIHGVSAYLLHADLHYHEIDIDKENGRHNWQYANRWSSYMDRLRPKHGAIQEELPFN